VRDDTPGAIQRRIDMNSYHGRSGKMCHVRVLGFDHGAVLVER
jgi:hypothetical protein